MENWTLKGAYNLVNEPSVSNNSISPTQVKVKVSYLLLTNFDAHLFSGADEIRYPKTLGRAATGIVTEVGENCYGVEKGARVYLKPTRPCRECLACRLGKFRECENVQVAGKDFDGFMRDFVVCEYTDVAPLPDAVDDIHALCIEAIGIAENIYDKLNLSAGQRVAVVGADLYGNVTAQVLQYHKIIPIVIDNTPSNLERVKKCGIYYAFAADDELNGNIENATSGKLCDAAVYCSYSRLPVSLAARLVAPDSKVVLSAPSTFNASIDVRDILEKQLNVFGVSNAYDYTDAVINMLVHNAVNIDFFEKEVLKEYNPAALLKERFENVALSKRGKMTVFKMIL